MRRALRRAAAAAALVACAAPAPAAAQSVFHPLELTQRAERAFGPVETDGRRWATFAPTAAPLADISIPSSTVVVDTERGVEWTVPGCGPSNPRGGHVGLRCSKEYRSLDLATRKISSEPPRTPGGEGPPPTLTRGGRILGVDSEAMIPTRLNRWGRPAPRSLVLMVEGKRRVVRRACRCTDIRFSAGWLTWSAGISVFAHDVETAKTWRWTPSEDALRRLGVPLPTGGRSVGADLLDVAHTRTRIFVSYRAGAVEPRAGEAWHVVFDGPLKPGA